jgi:hypothetical protein
MVLEAPIEGIEPTGTFSEEAEGDSFMSAMAGLDQG